MWPTAVTAGAVVRLAFAGGTGLGFGGFGGRWRWCRSFAFSSRLQARERLGSLLRFHCCGAGGRRPRGLLADEFFLGFVGRPLALLVALFFRRFLVSGGFQQRLKRTLGK